MSIQQHKLSRPMWVWNTHDILSSYPVTDQLFHSADSSSITDLYLYLDASHYNRYDSMLKAFNGMAYRRGIRIWGLEGGRVYFSDADGPGHFLEGIQNLIAFNDQVQESEKFAGFSADLEPYAKHGHHASFHSGIKGCHLNHSPGTGLWKHSQAADRDALMRDWLDIHKAAKDMLSTAGLPLAAALPHWLSDYCGEPLQVRWPTDEDPLRSVMELMMTCVDDYLVMSYHTNPVLAAARAAKAVECATEVTRCDKECRPRVLAAVETTKGVGATISYGDEATTPSKAFVLRDIENITEALKHHDSFGGVAIHAWSGWKELSDLSDAKSEVDA